jgi:hypothetical protein
VPLRVFLRKIWRKFRNLEASVSLCDTGTGAQADANTGNRAGVSQREPEGRSRTLSKQSLRPAIDAVLSGAASLLGATLLGLYPDKSDWCFRCVRFHVRFADCPHLSVFPSKREPADCRVLEQLPAFAQFNDWAHPLWVTIIFFLIVAQIDGLLTVVLQLWNRRQLGAITK